MGQNNVEMEDAGTNIEDSKGKVVNDEIESKAEKSPSPVTVANDVNESGSGSGVEDLNNLTNEAKNTTATKSEMEDQTNSESKAHALMDVEGSIGEQINAESKNEEKISTKTSVEEQNATRSTLERQTDATNEVVELEQKTSNCEVRGEKLADGVKGESPVKNATEENPIEDAAAEKPEDTAREDGNCVEHVARKEMTNENKDSRSDPTENRQFPTEISSNEAPQSQNAVLDAVPQGEDKEMKDASNENADKPVHHDPKQQAKEILLSSPVTGEDAKTVEPGTKHKGDESSLAHQHEAATPSSLVRYLPAKAEDHSGEIVKAPFTQAALPLMAEDDDGTPEDQAAFMKEIESFYRERGMDFKPPKFYGQPLNCLKLWRAVLRLGGYDRVTGSKLWRQVGESFHPPKTCTTVSWTFRIFYEKSLLEYERHKRQSGELQLPHAMLPEASGADSEGNGYQGSGSGRARRDAAARAMQGWHVQRLFDNGEVGEPVIKDKNLNSLAKREKNVKSIGTLKQKRPNEAEQSVKASRTETSKQLVTSVVDVGPPADWVKINVRQTKDCFEVYALVPGLLREEVRVQSDPAGRLVITGQPEQVDNPWGISPFKKVVNLPARIDPLQTSAVVSLHGRLFVRVPFEQSNS